MEQDKDERIRLEFEVSILLFDADLEQQHN